MKQKELLPAKYRLRLLFNKEKINTLKENEKLINRYKNKIEYYNNIMIDITKIKPYLYFCETKEDKQFWTAFVHLTTSLPFKSAVGRQIKIFVKDKNTDYILGMVQLTSDLAQLRVRDTYIGWSYKDKWEHINNILNIQICVPTRRYSYLLIGKLLVYCLFSIDIVQYYLNKYNDYLVGLTTTSLYGKSSMYNRIPFLKYLGLSDGMSAVYISNEEWKKILKEYYKYFPKTNTKRLAPVKYQIIDKLASYYKRHFNKEFPYEYQKIEYRRGVYFGYLCKNGKDFLNGKCNVPFHNVFTVYDSFINWKNRWFNPRYEKYKKEDLNIYG